MIVSHNIQSMNINRITNDNISLHGKSTEKVSSGYQINRAGDNPVGLSLSEKMRRQVRGLKMGVENTKAAINFCKVADGALSEVTEMLQRLNELSVQAETGTNTLIDRHAIQDEVEQILAEIDRVADMTTFNELHIFKGKDSLSESVGIAAKPSTDGKFFQLFGNNITKTGYMQEELKSGDVTKSTSTLNDGQPYVSVHLDIGKINNLKDLIDTGFFVNCCTDCCPTTVKFTDEEGIILTNSNNEYELQIGLKKKDMSYYNNAAEFSKDIVESLCSLQQNNPTDNIPHVEFAYKDSVLYIYDIDNNAWTQDQKELAYFCDSKEIYSAVTVQGIGRKLWIHSGNEAESGLWLEIDEMNTEVLGIDRLDLTTQDGAAKANIRVKEALKQLSLSRGKIGAQQNRLEHTVFNEENIAEKVGASESNIRDTDLSSEMIQYSNLSILLKMGSSMIAESNQRIEKLMTILQ